MSIDAVGPSANVINVLERRSARAIRAILEVVDGIDDDDLRGRVRKSVLDEFNEYKDISCQLVKTVRCDHVEINEYFLEFLENLDSRLPSPS